MRDAFVRALLEEMEADSRIVLITGDLGFGVLKPMWERFPDQIIDAGIAEQGMVSMAAGLAATGRTVFVYSIGNFLKIVCVGGGFVYGSLGMSHHATEDIAALRALPGVTCFTPGDPAEAEAVTHRALRTPGTCYLRLGRGNEPRIHPGAVEGWKMPEPLTLRKGTDTALLSAGGILTQTVEAAELLEARGISAEVVSFPCIKPMDTVAVLRLTERFRHIVTVEEHNIIGGFGSAVCEIAAETGNGCRIHRIGLQDCYTSVVGSQQYLREIYGMDAKAIAEKTEAWLNEA